MMSDKGIITKLALSEQDVLGDLPGHILLDIARNESATRAMRKAAVRLLIEKKFSQARHPELILLRAEIEDENEAVQEVQAIVESQIEGPLEDHPAPVETPGMTCGVTTKTLFGNGEVKPAE